MSSPLPYTPPPMPAPLLPPLALTSPPEMVMSLPSPDAWPPPMPAPLLPPMALTSPPEMVMLLPLPCCPPPMPAPLRPLVAPTLPPEMVMLLPLPPSAAADACGGDGRRWPLTLPPVMKMLLPSFPLPPPMPAPCWPPSGGQLAVLVLVRNGQAAAVVLFKAGMLIATPERASAVQLDADIALAGGGNGGLALIAHVDVHTGEGDACGLTAIRVDGDVVFLRGSRNDGRAVRYSGSASLRDRLPAASRRLR